MSASRRDDGPARDERASLPALADALARSAARREARLVALADLGRLGLQSGNVDRLLDEAATVVARLLDVPLVAVLERRRRADLLSLRAGVGWRDDAIGQRLTPAPGGTIATALHTREPATSTIAVPEEPLLRDHEVAASLVVVIRGPDEPFGVLAAFDRVPREFDAEDVVVLRSFANVIGAAAARDATERRLVLRDAEARLAFEAGRLGAWRWEPATGRVWWSPELERVYGVPPGTFAGTIDAFSASVHEDDRERVAGIVAEAQRTGTPIAMVHRIVRPDGSVRWLDGRGMPILGGDGAPAMWVGVGIDVTERMHVQHALAESELRLRLALDAGRMGVWEWDGRTGRSTIAEALSRALAVSPELLERDGGMAARLHPDDRERVVTAFRELAGTGAEFHDEVRVVLPGGATRWVECWATAVEPATDLARTRWVGVLVDVDARKRAEEERAQLLTRAHEAQARAERAARTLTEIVARLDTLLEHSPVGFAFFDCELRFVRVNEPFARIIGTTTDEPLHRSIADVLPSLWGRVRDPFRRVVATGEPIVNAEVSAQTPAAPGIERWFLLSCYPVDAANGERLGIGLVVMDVTDRRRADRGQQLLARASELFASSEDLGPLVDAAVQLAVPGFADTCTLQLLPADDDGLRIAVADRDPEMAERWRRMHARWPLDVDALAATALSTAEHGGVLVARVDDSLYRAMARGDEHLALLREHGIRSAIGVPLSAGGRVTGLLLLGQTDASGRVFLQEDVALAAELGRRLAQAVENARLARAADRARQRIDLLARASELLTVELNASARLAATARLVVPEFADICIVHAVRPDGSLEHEDAVTGDPDVAELLALGEGAWPPIPPMANTPAAIAVRTGRAVLRAEIGSSWLDDLELDDAQASAAGAFGIRSALAVPLVGPSGPFAVLTLLYAGSGRRYGPDDRSLFEELARRAAPAVDNALRYEQERATAEALQRSLLPERLPTLTDCRVVARYVPAAAGARVGGDWYDAIPLPDGSVILAIGDVVGHGLRAAASMGKLRNVLQFCALDGLSPDRVLRRLNEYFCSLVESDMATVLVARYEPRTRRFTYASAGHPPPLVVDGMPHFLESPNGLPLCVARDGTYESSTTVLEPDAMVLLYTDGLIERRGESLDVGLARLADAAGKATDTLGDLADHVLHELGADSGAADDVALLLLGTPRQADELALSLAARPDELRRMRHVLRGWLSDLGMDRVRAEELVVATNEACANAVEHAYGLEDATFEVVASVHATGVDVRVADHGRWRRRTRRRDRGRGLDLVEHLVDDVHVHPGEEGTTVLLHKRLGGPA